MRKKSNRKNIDIEKTKLLLSHEILEEMFDLGISFEEIALNLGITEEELISKFSDLKSTKGSELLLISKTVDKKKVMHKDFLK